MIRELTARGPWKRGSGAKWWGGGKAWVGEVTAWVAREGGGDMTWVRHRGE